jgi:hypothetical protein
MCLACVGAATPEVVVALGGYATVRFGRPVERVRSWLDRPQDRAGSIWEREDDGTGPRLEVVPSSVGETKEVLYAEHSQFHQRRDPVVR